MNILPKNSSLGEFSDAKEILLFCSQLKSLVVDPVNLDRIEFTHMRPDDVRVSEFGLERYLNACNPTCSG